MGFLKTQTLEQEYLNFLQLEEIAEFIEFYKNLITIRFPRDDYRELVKLSLLYLGEFEEGFSFFKTGGFLLGTLNVQAAV